ncbi:TIGR02677 family protein [Lentibacillus kapialis]|uniref:TIGR02677 family protein n=2 Tax=Lentibacillus kapialis TaxID=340214 RepID=A0A917UUL8_9BACI|nr:TIGR02677 family protein [Lentibacillus kapialis]
MRVIKMQTQPFKKVQEASYLTADKAWSYRAILRYFYIQHERMREFLFPEEILTHLKDMDGFQDYTEDQLHQDLDQLVKWNNLIARQEMSRASTIEEFKKKRYRYQSTPYTIEFERMLQEMEKGGNVFGGSLERKEFERLYQELLKIEDMINKDSLPSADECSQLWNDIFAYFRSINQNTSDYMAHINSEEAEERMQTEAFLAYKDQFTTYLRDFIIGLQQTALKIQELLQSISLYQLQPLINQVIIHQQQIPRFEDIGLDGKELITDQEEKWRSLCDWFLGNAHGESNLEMLQTRTNEQIRRITRVVQRLGERHHYFRSRKKDYLHLAEWFDSMEDVKEAHELSSVVFGLFHTRHLFSDHVPTDDIYTDIWNEAPMEHETKPRIRNYREKTKPGAIISQQKRKDEARAEHLREKQREQEALKQYMNGDKIELENLSSVEPFARKMFLSWIGKAMAQKERTFKTEYGRRIKVIIEPGKRIVLHAQDGDIEMPHVTFQFLDEVKR